MKQRHTQTARRMYKQLKDLDIISHLDLKAILKSALSFVVAGALVGFISITLWGKLSNPEFFSGGVDLKMSSAGWWLLMGVGAATLLFAFGSFILGVTIVVEAVKTMFESFNYKSRGSQETAIQEIYEWNEDLFLAIAAMHIVGAAFEANRLLRPTLLTSTTIALGNSELARSRVLTMMYDTNSIGKISALYDMTSDQAQMGILVDAQKRGEEDELYQKAVIWLLNLSKDIHRIADEASRVEVKTTKIEKAIEANKARQSSRYSMLKRITAFEQIAPVVQAKMPDSSHSYDAGDINHEANGKEDE